MLLTQMMKMKTLVKLVVQLRQLKKCLEKDSLSMLKIVESMNKWLSLEEFLLKNLLLPKMKIKNLEQP
jgi:hypothetical protein